MNTGDADLLATPPDYESWSADEKARWMWDELIIPTRHASTELPPLQVPLRERPLRSLGVLVRSEQLERTLTRSEDLMEPGRPKIIHARGAVAQITLEVNADSPFTGLLAPPPAGGATGLIRVSLVGLPSDKMATTPAFGLKLFVDGMASADVLAINHTVGQGRDHNVFSNTMSNDITGEHDRLRRPQKVMAWFFKRVSHEPRRLTSSHLCTHTRDGRRIDEPRAPHRLVFRPTREARALFAGTAGVDFRLVLGSAPPDLVLYDVEAEVDGAFLPLGRIRTRSHFVSSGGGDRLFFRHVQERALRKV